MLLESFIKERIGTPYEVKDCWGLAKDFYSEVLDEELPEYYSIRPEEDANINKVINEYISNFKSVDNPRLGDLILLRVTSIPCHIGIYIDSNIFLHTTRTTGAIVDRLNRWGKRVEGYYRVL